MASKTIGEIFEMVNAVPSKKEKAEVFKQNKSNALVSFLLTYMDETPWVYENRPVPKFTTDYPPHGYAENTLANCLKKLHIFREGTNITPKRQDEQFIQIIESLSEIEAEILLAMVRREKLPSKMVTKKFIEDLFAGKI